MGKRLIDEKLETLALVFAQQIKPKLGITRTVLIPPSKFRTPSAKA
jgi:hypothetical protein